MQYCSFLGYLRKDQINWMFLVRFAFLVLKFTYLRIIIAAMGTHVILYLGNHHLNSLSQVFNAERCPSREGFLLENLVCYPNFNIYFHLFIISKKNFFYMFSFFVSLYSFIATRYIFLDQGTTDHVMALKCSTSKEGHSRKVGETRSGWKIINRRHTWIIDGRVWDGIWHCFSHSIQDTKIAWSGTKYYTKYVFVSLKHLTKHQNAITHPYNRN